MDAERIPESALLLATRLKRVRDSFLAFFCSALNRHKARPGYTARPEAAVPVLSAFQLAHVGSFIHLHDYVPEEQIGAFLRRLLEQLYGPPDDKVLRFIGYYDSQKQAELADQSRRVCEDAAMAVLDSSAGMIYGPLFVLHVVEFVHRSWCMTADHFGDTPTARECLTAVTCIRNAQ